MRLRCGRPAPRQRARSAVAAGGLRIRADAPRRFTRPPARLMPLRCGCAAGALRLVMRALSRRGGRAADPRGCTSAIRAASGTADAAALRRGLRPRCASVMRALSRHGWSGRGSARMRLGDSCRPGTAAAGALRLGHARAQRSRLSAADPRGCASAIRAGPSRLMRLRAGCTSVMRELGHRDSVALRAGSGAATRAVCHRGWVRLRLRAGARLHEGRWLERWLIDIVVTADWEPSCFTALLGTARVGDLAESANGCWRW
jgi:hypothetical protein